VNHVVLLEKIAHSLEPFRKDRFRFELQKAATLPINAISPVSGDHMVDKYKKLHNLLSGKSAIYGMDSVRPAEHPLGVLMVTDIIAKLFVVSSSILCLRLGAD